MATINTTMTRTQKVTLLAQPLLGGKASILSEKPVWTVNDPLLVTLAPSGDGLLCDVKASGFTGIVIVTCTASGQTALTATVQITITNDFADTLNIKIIGPITQ